MLLVAAIALVLAACATPPPVYQPSQEEWTTAMTDASKCAVGAIQRLDDGVTGADVIARRVASECAMQDRKSAILYAEHWGFPQSVVIDAMNNSYSSAVAVDTDLILQGRVEANRYKTEGAQ